MNHKYRWALLGALLAFSTSAFAGIPSTPPPVTPDPEPPSVVNDNDNTAVGADVDVETLQFRAQFDF